MRKRSTVVVVTLLLLAHVISTISSQSTVPSRGYFTSPLPSRCDPDVISCQCGTDLKEVKVEIRKCNQNGSCEPCPDILTQNACNFLQNCSRCYDATNTILNWCKSKMSSQACSCQNGGECSKEGLCLCPKNFTGKNCETQQPLGSTFETPTETWTTSPPINIPNDITCPLPNYPVNGNLIFDTVNLSLMDYVKYVCDDGFTLIGNSVRRCQDDGRLSGEEPRCEKLCSVPKITGNQVGTYIKLNPDNDTSAIDTFGNVIVNDIEFICEEGWRMSGPSRIKCVGGKWNKDLPSCQWYGVSCRDPGTPEHSERQPPVESSIWAPGTTFQYSCVGDAIMFGEGAGVVVCSYSGQWSSPPPRCLLSPPADQQQGGGQTEMGTTTTIRIEVTAEGPPAPPAPPGPPGPPTTPMTQDNGAPDQATTVGNSVVAPTMSPMNNLLSGNQPTCDTCCPQPSPLKHGKQYRTTPWFADETQIRNPEFVSQGTTISYTCDRFYQLDKNVSRSCQSNNMWSGVEPMCKPVCGSMNDGKLGFVVGGDTSTAGKWPWPVALINQKVGSFFCSGTLLSENWVVTAAHCVVHMITHEPDITIYLGKTSFDQPTRDHGTVLERRVKQIVVHEDFNEQTIDSDIALLMMNEPVEFDKVLRPICLPKEDSVITYTVGNTGTVAGWGSRDPVVFKTSPDLQEIQLPVAACEARRHPFKPNPYSSEVGTITTTDNMFCAGFENGGRGVCFGDSGSGMYFNVGSADAAIYVLEGIVSWGPDKNCVVAGHFPGFVRVRNFVVWIRSKITDVV